MKTGSPIPELVARFALVASLVITILLAHALWQKRSALNTPILADALVITNTPPVVDPPSLPAAVVVTNNPDPFCGFKWADAYSTNHLTYASNLVALGCPLKTVHAVLSAGMLRDRERDIAALPEPPFWADSETRLRMEFEKVVMEEQIRHSYSLLLWQLTGEPLRECRRPSDISETILTYAIVSVLVGPIEREKRFSLIDLIQRMDESGGRTVAPQFEREWQRRQGQQFVATIESLLTPAEQDSAFARTLCMMGGEGIVKAARTPAELQQITTALAPTMRPKVLEMLGMGIDEDDAEDFFKSALLSNLTDDMKWTLLQEEDSGFRQFSEPLATAPNRGTVLETVWEANALLKEIEMDPALGVDDKLRQLEQGRMAAAAAVLGLVGEAEFGRVWLAIDRWLGTRESL